MAGNAQTQTFINAGGLNATSGTTSVIGTDFVNLTSGKVFAEYGSILSLIGLVTNDGTMVAGRGEGGAFAISGVLSDTNTLKVERGILSLSAVTPSSQTIEVVGRTQLEFFDPTQMAATITGLRSGATITLENQLSTTKLGFTSTSGLSVEDASGGCWKASYLPAAIPAPISLSAPTATAAL